MLLDIDPPKENKRKKDKFQKLNGEDSRSVKVINNMVKFKKFNL